MPQGKEQTRPRPTVGNAAQREAIVTLIRVQQHLNGLLAAMANVEAVLPDHDETRKAVERLRRLLRADELVAVQTQPGSPKGPAVWEVQPEGRDGGLFDFTSLAISLAQQTEESEW